MYLLSCFLLLSVPAFSMHIVEGYLPIKWALFWWILFIPFFGYGMKRLKTSLSENLDKKLLSALITAFIFFISAIKLPSLTGSSSHMTGIALGAILLGPGEIFVLGCLVLFFQATLLAHGGLTTLGANAFSMAVVGTFVAWFIYKIARKRLGDRPALFLAAFAGDLLTYVFTSLQLALAHPAEGVGYMESFIKFMGVFSITQVPLAVVEGIITVIVIGLLPKELLSSSLLKAKNIKAGAIND